jgi:hypothetical protein
VYNLELPSDHTPKKDSKLLYMNIVLKLFWYLKLFFKQFQNMHIVRSVCPNRKCLTKLLEILFEHLANTSFRPAKHANSSQNRQIVQKVFDSFAKTLVFLQTVCVQLAYSLQTIFDNLRTKQKQLEVPKQ